ncbi:MAG: DUF1588 domain-containing protein, partial [Planctomycetota bacterium]
MRHSLFLLFVLVAAGSNDGLAESPRQWNTLSIEDAQRLAQDKRGGLNLSSVTTLSPEVAKELAKLDGWLWLNGITALTNESAAALAQHKGMLHLNGLTNLSDECAAALARHSGELSLNGLTSLSVESAREFAKHAGGRLYLKGITTLSVEAVQAIAQRKVGGPTGQQVHLEGLTTLSAETAAVLAQTPAQLWDGRLPAIKTLPADVARALAKRQGTIYLEGLTTLSDETAQALQGKLDGNLPNLTSLTPVSAKALGESTRILNGLTTMSEDLAQAIADNGRGALHLNGLKTLTPEAARFICKREGDVHLNGLTTFPDDALKVLVDPRFGTTTRRNLYLKGLPTVSDEAATMLAVWPKWSGELPALTSLSETAAAALASSRYWDGQLPSLAAISPAVARALSQRQGHLTLDGLTSLSDESSQELAKHQGGRLSLNGLKKLSETAAAAFARHEGRLSLNGLAEISSEIATSLGKHKGDWLILDGLTTLSEDGAKALAQHQGIVSLAGLATLSEGAVHALKANPKVGLSDKYRAWSANAKSRSADVKSAQAFLESHCVDCHNGNHKEGDFAMDKLSFDTIPGRVAYASILERLRAGDMPPSVEDRPDPAESAGVAQWIASQLDAPFTGLATHYAVKEKPVDGNRLPHAILFGGPRGPSVPPAPRLWRLSPAAYSKSISGISVSGLQQPFGLIHEAGFRDFSALYSPDEGATSLLLTNAEQVVLSQVRGHALVNILQTPDLSKEALWPSEGRMKAATEEERKHLEKGDRVRQGFGPFAPLMHPKVAANRDELAKALNHQFQAILSRTPNETELESLLEVYKDVAKHGDYSLAGKTILMAPLITPEAILRFEVGLGAEVRPGVRMLSPRETAFALSLALSTKRDLGLLSVAAQGKLTTREEVAGAVRGILDDPKLGKSRVLWFFREYFDYYRATDVFKDPLPFVLQRRGIYYDASRYVADTDTFVVNILGEDKDVLKELLTSSASVASHELLEGGAVAILNDASSNQLSRALPPHLAEKRPRKEGANLASGNGIGIPMQSSWLVAWSTNFDNDIVRRGRWVREHMLGGRVPDLPINVAAMVPEDPHRTLRERQVVTRAAACWKCHYRMDDLGTPFEHIDHYGFVRAAEPVLDLEAIKSAKDKKAKIYRDAPLDTTGFILHSGDPKLDGPVKDAPEMLRRLADSERVRQVFIRHAFRFFLGRNETPGDA